MLNKKAPKIGGWKFVTTNQKNSVAYLLYFVKSPYFIEHGKINFSGTAGQQRFGTDAVKRTFIPIPPYNEQIRICNQIEVMLGKLKDEN